MTVLQLAALLLTLAAFFSYLNHRFVGLPTTIGIMLISMVMSLAVVLLGKLGFTELRDFGANLIASIDFNETLMQGMLSFLLFAGALHVDWNELARQKGIILSLATVGVITTTFLVGGATWLIFRGIGVELSFIYCLLFGSLIAPTDPVAVLGILKTAGAPKSLEIKIVGESLFNDGVAVVVFIALLGIAAGGQEASAGGIALLFAEEALGGIVFGAVNGYVAIRLLRDVDNYQVEVLITLALVMGGYTAANAIHVSGPIAIVVAGLLIGNRGRYLAMSERTRQHLDSFWELMDEILNAVLFLLIGLELLALTLGSDALIVGAILIPLVLAARLVSVSIPVMLMRRFREFSPNVIKILTWGGLRGGISVALVLSLPAGPERSLLLTITYMIVVFSILVQGLTLKRLVARR